MRKHVLIGLASVGEAGMTPFVPMWAVAFCGGLLLAATIATYSSELRTAGAWVWQRRKRRNREIAQEILNIRRKEIAETIAREFAPKKAPPAASDDERPR